MSEMVRAIETFACELGLVHWHSELPADAEVVKAFPQFFEPVAKIVGEHGPEPKLPKKAGAVVRNAALKKAAPRKAANG